MVRRKPGAARYPRAVSSARVEHPGAADPASLAEIVEALAQWQHEGAPAVEDGGPRVEPVGPSQVHDRVAVQREAFDNSTFTVERWHTMAAAPPYGRARCLVAYDPHGYGRAITLAAATPLREMGSSSATLCTPAADVGGVATYASAGLDRCPGVTDFRKG